MVGGPINTEYKFKFISKPFLISILDLLIASRWLIAVNNGSIMYPMLVPIDEASNFKKVRDSLDNISSKTHSLLMKRFVNSHQVSSFCRFINLLVEVEDMM